MAIKSLIELFSNTPVMLMLRIGKLTKETCRTGFVLTAISEGVYDIMQSGPATFEEIQKLFKSDFDMVTFYNLIYYFTLDERIDLLKDLGKHLKPGGELIFTSMCKGKDPSLSLMNLWTSMTDGYGPLPSPKQIRDQLKKAGYHKINSEMLIPSFVLFRVTK